MKARTALAWLLTLAGAGLLGFVALVAIQSSRLRQRAQAQFARPLADPWLAPPPSPPLAAGDLLGELEAPRLGLRVAVTEGDSDLVLRLGVGHIPGTALPGAAGNVALAAHRDSFFRPLKDIHTGDLLRLTTAAGSYAYRVTSTAVVPPDDVAVLAPTPTATLTLITCYPFYYIGPAPRRFIVRAAEVAYP